VIGGGGGKGGGQRKGIRRTNTNKGVEKELEVEDNEEGRVGERSGTPGWLVPIVSATAGFSGAYRPRTVPCIYGRVERTAQCRTGSQRCQHPVLG